MGEKLYQILFIHCEGVFPQHEVYTSKDEAERVVKLYNSQNNNPWCCYKLKEIKVENKGEE